MIYVSTYKFNIKGENVSIVAPFLYVFNYL